jgi:WD and tetratricopeptide repeat-containing protein 1
LRKIISEVVKDRNLAQEPQNTFEPYLRKKANDYHQRYYGHCNTSTDIKEANFFGR